MRASPVGFARLRGNGPAAGSGARGSRGQPLWPDGVIGAVSHCVGYRTAALVRGGFPAPLTVPGHRGDGSAVVTGAPAAGPWPAAWSRPP
ncbi:hypothetical protein ACIPJM_30155 [Streptomyces halstedii]|uniref:hypothetical protein n=1 Tax=Streptomyces halstedii TaxID=1944 RepID=UPI003811E8DC